MPKYLVISTSGNPQSRSRKMGRIAFHSLTNAQVDCEWLDVSELALPLCDADQCYIHADTRKAATAIAAADGIIVSAPVYNYDVSASAKNMIELTGKAWEDKIVGFLCAAGGMSSYMSVMAYANSLMLDFRCVIVPRFVYATGASFTDGELTDTKVSERIAQVSAEVVRFTQALRSV
ncbi:MAG: NADPH-dependent FMN reductase [Chthoniobacterales bacterium]